MQNNNALAWEDFRQGNDEAAQRITLAASQVKPSKIQQLRSVARNAFKFVSIDQMELTEPQFLIDELMEMQNLALIFGAPGCGKSFVAVDMACCIATGRQFHGRDVKQGLVFYIAGEGHQGFKRRFSAWEKHNNVDGLDDCIFISSMAGNLVSTYGTQEIMNAIQGLSGQHGEPALIVIDTVARSFGSGDENSQKDMGTFVTNADSIKAHFPQSTVLLIHHTGHGDKGRARGSSALKAAVDAEYKVSLDGDTITIENHKMKDSEPPKPIYFNLQNLTLGIDSKGKPYGSAVLVPTDKPTQSEPKISANDKIAIQALKAVISTNDAGAIPKKLWREEFDKLHEGKTTDAKRKAFGRSLTALVEQGSVTVLEDDNYSLP